LNGFDPILEMLGHSFEDEAVVEDTFEEFERNRDIPGKIESYKIISNFGVRTNIAATLVTSMFVTDVGEKTC